MSRKALSNICESRYRIMHDGYVKCEQKEDEAPLGFTTSGITTCTCGVPLRGTNLAVGNMDNETLRSVTDKHLCAMG